MRPHENVGKIINGTDEARDVVSIMIKTRDFRDVVLENAIEDPVFRAELFREALECLNDGDTKVGVSLLQDYFNATSALLAAHHGDSGMNIEKVFLYDHINAVIGFDEAAHYATGHVWQSLVCPLRDAEGNANVAMV